MFLERMQKGLAHIPGIPLNTYTNWVRGIRAPCLEWFVHICTALGVPADWLSASSRRAARCRCAKL